MDRRDNLKATSFNNRKATITGRCATNLERGLSLVYWITVGLAAVFFVAFNSLYVCLGTTQLLCSQIGLSYQGYFFGLTWLDPVLALSNSLILILTISIVVARRNSLLEGQTEAIAAVVVKYVIGPIFIAWMLLGIYIVGISVRYVPQGIPFLTSSYFRIFVDGYVSEIANSFFLGLFYGLLFVPGMPILGSVWVRLHGFVRRWVLGTTSHDGSNYDEHDDEFSHVDEFKRLIFRGLLFAVLLPLLPTGKSLVRFTTEGNPPVQLLVFTQEIMALFAFVPLIIGLGYHLEHQGAGTRTSAASYHKWLFAVLSLSGFVGLVSFLWQFSQDVVGGLFAFSFFFGAYMTILGGSLIIKSTNSWRDRIAKRTRWKLAGIIPLFLSPIFIQPALEVMINWTQPIPNPTLGYVHHFLFTTYWIDHIYADLVVAVVVAALVLVFKSRRHEDGPSLRSPRWVLAIGLGVVAALTQTRPIDGSLAFPWRMELCALLTVLLVVSLRWPPWIRKMDVEVPKRNQADSKSSA